MTEWHKEEEGMKTAKQIDMEAVQEYVGNLAIVCSFSDLKNEIIVSIK